MTALLLTLLLAINPPLPNAEVQRLLPPGPGNPRNTEGAFVTLKDGRILFAYSRFAGTSDHAPASIVGRYSADGGKTWSTTDVPIVSGEGGMNVMSVSLLRLRDGRIALFYLRKNSLTDCHPYLRYSTDEGRSWSEPIPCVPEPGYYVLNNDRAVQLRTGRILMPVALHEGKDQKWSARGIVFVYYSDDNGKTWQRGPARLECPTDDPNGFQEPGVVELKNGAVMMFIRTQLGSQYVAHSKDGGWNWTRPEASSLKSPLSPASIKRVPKTGDLLVVYNDHAAGASPRRTPLTVAVSKDEGKTWVLHRDLHTAADGWYCYTAIHFVGSDVLLGYVAGGEGQAQLSGTAIARFQVASLYRN